MLDMVFKWLGMTSNFTIAKAFCTRCNMTRHNMRWDYRKTGKEERSKKNLNVLKSKRLTRTLSILFTVEHGMKRGKAGLPLILWVFRCEEHLYTKLCWSVGLSVGPSPRCAITWKNNSYGAIDSRRGGGSGNWTRRDSITARPLHPGIRRSPCFFIIAKVLK